MLNTLTAELAEELTQAGSDTPAGVPLLDGQFFAISIPLVGLTTSC